MSVGPARSRRVRCRPATHLDRMAAECASDGRSRRTWLATTRSSDPARCVRGLLAGSVRSRCSPESTSGTGTRCCPSNKRGRHSADDPTHEDTTGLIRWTSSAIGRGDSFERPERQVAMRTKDRHLRTDSSKRSSDSDGMGCRRRHRKRRSGTFRWLTQESTYARQMRCTPSAGHTGEKVDTLTSLEIQLGRICRCHETPCRSSISSLARTLAIAS